MYINYDIQGAFVLFNMLLNYLPAIIYTKAKQFF